MSPLAFSFINDGLMMALYLSVSHPLLMAIMEIVTKPIAAIAVSMPRSAPTWVTAGPVTAVPAKDDSAVPRNIIPMSGRAPLPLMLSVGILPT